MQKSIALFLATILSLDSVQTSANAEYVRNDPVNLTDPTGEAAWFALANPVVRGAIGGANSGFVGGSVLATTGNPGLAAAATAAVNAPTNAIVGTVHRSVDGQPTTGTDVAKDMAVGVVLPFIGIPGGSSTGQL